jgi:hypothetical protein
MVARHVVPLGQASHWLVSLQCLLSFALIVVLNTWWFLKMAQGLLRLLHKKESAKDKNKDKDKDKAVVDGGASSLSSSPTVPAAAPATRRRAKRAA